MQCPNCREKASVQVLTMAPYFGEVILYLAEKQPYSVKLHGETRHKDACRVDAKGPDYSITFSQAISDSGSTQCEPKIGSPVLLTHLNPLCKVRYQLYSW